MKSASFVLAVALAVSTAGNAFGQITSPLPGRTIDKLLPDYSRPLVYALNQGNGSAPGTLLALNASNGAVVQEISVNLNPTDMAMTPAGDALYVINAGSRTISKVDLTSFSVAAEEAISTPSTYSLSNPLHLVAGQGGKLYYTDGAWGPEIYYFDFNAGTNQMVLDTGGNQDFGAGGMVLNRSGSDLYIWRQYGWGAGNVNSWVSHFATSAGGSLTAMEDSFTSWRRDPLDTPLFLDGAERWVFNKEQMFAATNVAVLVNQFSDNIYGISLDGSIAFGPTEVFNTQNGTTLTNLPFSTTVQTLSGDQKKLFRYNSSTASVVVFDMASIASVSGPNIVPTPADGSVVSLPLTNLTWTVSPFALSYDVYFGTNQAQVAGATPTSPQYLGRVTTPGEPLAQALTPGASYFWRVDILGFNATNTGAVWAFTASTLSLAPSQITYSAIAGYNPPVMTLNLTSGAAVAWSAAVTGASWLTVNPGSGTAPDTASLTFNTASLPAGHYTNNVEFTVGALKLELPVALDVKALNIVKMAADQKRPYIYALQAPTLSGQDGLLLFINTTNGNIDKTLTIGVNPTDLSINYPEGRLYIASWGETWTYVVDLNTQSLLPPLNLGTDVYKINALRLGRIVTEGEDQWIAVNLVDTTSGTVINGFPYPEREGDGEADPTGTVYYHCDNNISDANIHKFIVTNDTPVEVTGSDQHPYGTRNLVLSANGSRLFWNSYVYDTNLNDLGTLGTEIYSCTGDGRVAFGGSQAFDTVTRQAIYNLPASTSISAVDGGNQRFWYFNSGNGTLGSIPLTTIESPTITQQPAGNTAVLAGSSVYLTVTAMGIAPLGYQWTLAGTNLPGMTNYFLSLNNLQPGQQGAYRVMVSNSYGAATSTVAQVTVLSAPSIASQSVGTNVFAGRPFSLSVTAGGTAPFTYSWLFQNKPIPGANGPTLTITNAQPGNEGAYQAVVANSVGSAASAVMSVRVMPAAPVIVNGPISLSVPASSNVVFSVGAAGSAPFTYQWFFGNAPINGATGPQLALTDVQSGNAGVYQVVVANSLGTNSATATLTVTPLAPYFFLIPIGASASAGSSQTFLGQARGSEPIYYQWQHANTNLPGATQVMLTLPNLTLDNAGAYVLLASNIAGITPTPAAQLTVYQTPSVQQGLTNRVVDAGDTVALAVTASGSPAPVYYWQWNGAPMTGSGPTLTLTNIQPAQSGFYSVTVSNQFGSASSTARVSVFGLPSTVVAWGDNSGGQTNFPTGLADVVAVAGGDYHSLALRHDGTLAACGYDGYGQTNVPTSPLRFVAIAAGADHNLAVLENGSVTGWGLNDSGQAKVPLNLGNNVLAVAAGDAHSLALLASGTVVGWGDNSFGQISVPYGLNNVRAIAAGREDSLALQANGTVVGWGYNASGQATPPAGLANVVAIAAGYLHSAALLANGTVVAWGDDTYGQTNVPAGLTNVIAIAAGDFDTLALRADGTIVGWGDDSFGQTDVPTFSGDAVAVAAGNYHGLALVAPPVLQMQRLAAGLQIQWHCTAVLQWAPTPAGPWTDVTTQGNLYTNMNMTAPSKFFRLRR